MGAEIITLRAIALKRLIGILTNLIKEAEIITLRAIALKPKEEAVRREALPAEIITLRAIALKRALPALAACSIAQRS